MMINMSFSLFQATLYTPSHESNLCATKSSCNKGGNLGFLQSCVANSEPEAIPDKDPMDSEAFYFFNYMCPHLAKSRNSQVCCDTPQLLQLKVHCLLDLLFIHYFPPKKTPFDHIFVNYAFGLLKF